MQKIEIFRKTQLLLLGFLIVIMPCMAAACGIDWSSPSGHFEGVDYQGHVHLVQRFGEITGKSEKFPLNIIFNSSYGISPYGGAGFEIPLLEAKMYQVDENTFLLKNPAGWLWPFVRTKDKNILDGTAGWKAVINGDTITAWAPCGGKMIFNKGKIVRLESKKVALDYIYSGALLSEIKEGLNTVLRVNLNTTTGEVQGINLESEEMIHFEKSQKPRVQNIGQKNGILGMDSTISKIICGDGKEIIYEFGVDEQIQPMIKINRNRMIVWSPTTSSIVSDGDWNYNISRKEGAFSYSDIQRTNSNKKQESYKYDPVLGEENFTHADGFSRKRTWFTSGKLAGHPKKIIDTIDGREVRNRKWNYDENGYQLRLLDTAEGDFDLQRKLFALANNTTHLEKHDKQ